MMQQAISTKDGTSLATVRHLLPVQHAANGPPTIYTVYLAPDDKGTFLVTCRELPDLLTFGEDEEEALAMAEHAIREAFAARPSAPDFPY